VREGIWRRVGCVLLPRAQLEEEAKNLGKNQVALKDLVHAGRRVEGSCMGFQKELLALVLWPQMHWRAAR